MEKQNEVIIGIRVEMLAAQKQLKRVQQHLNNLARGSTKAFRKVAEAQEIVRHHSERLTKALSNGRVQFAGWAMSIMFFGMALTRTFNQITRFGTKTFQDVMHSVEGTVTNFDLLDGSLKFLGFTIGQAFEPFIGYLIPIVDKVTDWISQNQKLFTGIVAALGVGGFVLTAFGGGVLALNGFIEAFGLLKVAVAPLAAAGGPLLVIAGVLAGLAAISWKSFSETPAAWEAIKNAFKGIKESGVLGDLKESLENLIQSIFPIFILNWEEIAWLLAWVGSVAAESFKIVISAISAVINSLSVLIDILQLADSAVQALFTWDKETIVSAANTFKNSWKNASADIAKNVNSIGDAVMARRELMMMGPVGFKEQSIARQKAEAELKVPINQGTPFADQSTTKGDVIVQVMLDTGVLANAVSNEALKYVRSNI